jgi:transcriptional regulator with XRE-family HTH domain
VTEEPVDSLAQAIKKARGKRTQLDLAYALREHDARLSKTSPNRLSEWEQGKTPELAFFVVVAIAEVTEAPLEMFAEAARRERQAAAVADARARAEGLGRRPRRRERSAGS